ncbi:TPA: hypothetical protein EYP13_00240, partial [Candidatus Micrarchaeota archaeon]|nr:hypothetical protein [Candidatus Micrarchaeota archaeon]
MMSVKVIIVAGYPRAGKDSFASLLPGRKIVYSDIIRAVAGKDVPKEKLGEVGNRLREEHGPDYLTRYALALAEEYGVETLVLVGPRHPAEVSFVRENVREHV